jgi:hypothetical protein
MRKILLVVALVLAGLNIAQAVHFKHTDAELMRQIRETSQCYQDGKLVDCSAAYVLGHRYLCTVHAATKGHTTTECTEFRGIAVTDHTDDSGRVSL